MKSLEEYFRDNHKRNIIDHTIRADVDPDGNVSFYVHPATVSGDTLDFVMYYDRAIPAQVKNKDGTNYIKKAKEIIKEQQDIEFERFKYKKKLIKGEMV